LATADVNGNPLPDFDGSTWDPWAKRLLFTAENGANGGVWAQRNALDSGYVLDVTRDYSDPANQPVRWLAQGGDASATLDSAFGGFATSNEGDNEITGAHVS